MKLLILFAILILSFTGETQAYTLHVEADTYSHGYERNKDTQRDHRAVQHGGAKTLIIKKETIDEYGERRSYDGYVRFNMKELMETFSSAAVLSATLRIYIKRIATAGFLTINRVRDSWEEETLTWLDYPGVTFGPDWEIKTYLDTHEHDKNKRDFIFVDVTAHLKYQMEAKKEAYSIGLYPDRTLNIELPSKEGGMYQMEIEVMLGVSE